MKLLMLNLALAIVWVLVGGSFTLANLVFGFALGTLALIIVRGEIGTARYARRLLGIGGLAFLFLKELLLSAFKVARIVLSPNMNLEPGILAFPLTVTRDAEITLLANMITLTPGTLSIDVSEDRSTLYVHALDCSDAQATRREIAEGFETRILEVLR